MAREVALGPDETGRIRQFWAGFGLAVITLGLYEAWWYYRLNRELRSVGRLVRDEGLRRSKPALSTAAVVLAGLAAPFGDGPLVLGIGLALGAVALFSQYRFGKRVARAGELVGIVPDERFRPSEIFLLWPGGLFILPPFFWYASVTRHQNAVLEAAAARPPVGGAAFVGAPG